MKRASVVIPTVATVAVILLGVIVVALVARGVLASEPASRIPVQPRHRHLWSIAPPNPLRCQKSRLILPRHPRKLHSNCRYSRTSPCRQSRRQRRARQARPVLSRRHSPRVRPTHGRTATERSTVLLQDDLVVQKTSEVSATDVVVSKGVVYSIVQKQASHVANAGPVFKSESGGELMTLPGGVLLALDPTWDETQVEDFFSENGISADQVSELDFIENGFVVETGVGFPIA